MKNEASRTNKTEKKVGLNAAALPWWARVFMAQHSHIALPTVNPHHIHHCSDCGCVLISTDMAYRFAPALCPECCEKKRSQGGN